ncbi:MAG: hypothetical protein RJA36_2949 [Pseudomonadota bacterium]|jgi:cell division protein FtsN
MNKQAGGTLAGFLIGLLVGLGAALAVAVYVTKVPIPLVDRGLQRKPDQDAKEQERNKDWNPNAGLASKSVPATKPAEEAPAATSAPAPASVPAEPVAAKPAGAARPGGRDPLGELIQSRADGGTAKAEPDADPFIYFIQAGAFRSPEDAESQRAKLAMLGFDAKVSEREQAGRLVYRVRLGPFRQKGEADRAQERLAVQGVEGALVRTQR